MKYRKIIVHRPLTSPIQLIKWLRQNRKEESLQEAVEWVKALPQEIDVVAEPEFEKLASELLPIADFTSEIVGDTSYQDISWTSVDGYKFSDRHTPEHRNALKDAYEWLDRLSETDQARVKTLCANSGPRAAAC